MNGRLFCLALPLLVGSELAGQANSKKPQPTPVVSGRYYTGGSAKLTVTGAFQIDSDVPINVKASFGDGTMTWIQFGVSGAAEPNVLLTYGDQGVGIIVGLGKNTATAEPTNEDTTCTGETKVTPTSVTGQYNCPGVVSYNPGTGKMGKINITVEFTATS